MWPQPPFDINIMHNELVLKQESKAVSVKKAALLLEQRFVRALQFPKKETNITRYYQGTSSHHHFEPQHVIGRRDW